MKRGKLEVICGCMYCGKTARLISRAERAMFARQKVQAFKHALDCRYGEAVRLASHHGQTLDAIAVDSVMAISDLVSSDTNLVIIDEGQFFDWQLIVLCEILVSRGVNVVVAGLDMDFRGEPFEVMAELMARAEGVVKLTAICVRCGEEATRSQRIIDGQPAPFKAPIVVVGAEDLYEARCANCHEVPRKPPAVLQPSDNAAGCGG